MKRANRITSIGILIGLLATGFGTVGCGSGTDEVDGALMDSSFYYSDGTTRMSTGQVTFHVTMMNDGKTFSNSLYTQSYNISGGNAENAVINVPFGMSVTVDSSSVIDVIECSADITDTSNGGSTQYTGVPAFTPAGGVASTGSTACSAQYQDDGSGTNSGTIVITGAFKLPSSQTTPNPTPTGDPGTGGPTAFLELLNPHRSLRDDATYNRNSPRPDGSGDGSGSVGSLAGSARS